MTNNTTTDNLITIQPVNGDAKNYTLDHFKKDDSEEIYLNISMELILKKLNDKFLETKNNVYTTIAPKIINSILVNKFIDQDLYIVINIAKETYEIHTDCLRFFEFLLWRTTGVNDANIQAVLYKGFIVEKDFDYPTHMESNLGEHLGYGTTKQASILHFNDVQSCSSPYPLSPTFHDYINLEEWFRNEILGEVVFAHNNHFFYY